MIPSTSHVDSEAPYVQVLIPTFPFPFPPLAWQRLRPGKTVGSSISRQRKKRAKPIHLTRDKMFFYFSPLPIVPCCLGLESSVANCVHQSVNIRMTCPSLQVVISANIMQQFWKGNTIKKALARSLFVPADFYHDNAY